jgi:hypothetical protein
MTSVKSAACRCWWSMPVEELLEGKNVTIATQCGSKKVWFVKVKKIGTVVRIDYEYPVNETSLLPLMDEWAADICPTLVCQNPCVLDARMATHLRDWMHRDILNRLPRAGIKIQEHVCDDNCDPEMHNFMPFPLLGAPWLDCKCLPDPQHRKILREQ